MKFLLICRSDRPCEIYFSNFHLLSLPNSRYYSKCDCIRMHKDADHFWCSVTVLHQNGVLS